MINKSIKHRLYSPTLTVGTNAMNPRDFFRQVLNLRTDRHRLNGVGSLNFEKTVP